jgi:hypothetical protein
VIWFAFLRRYWLLIPVCGIGLFIIVLMYQRDAARTKLSELQDNVAAIRAANQSAIEKAKHDKENADAAYRSSNNAAVLFGRALSARMRQYQASLHSNPVPAPSKPPEAPRVDPVPAAIEEALDACARDANRLQNAIDWASGLKQ